jgi:HK97 family phage prohead protease
VQVIHKTHSSGFDEGLNCVLSDLTPDAYSDIVGDRADPMLGWDVADFKRNPIALWSHDSRSPIGTWKDVHVEDSALRGRLHLAPPGSTKLVDELRALLAANVVKGISVGFKPVESKPRSNGGVHYLRQTLLEASLVSVPANPSALLTAKALGISEATQRLIFKQTDFTIAQRIRKARRAIRKAKLLQERADNPRARAAMARVIAHFEQEKRELCASMSPRPSAEDRRRVHAMEVRARAMAQIREGDERRAREYAASPAGQQQQHLADVAAAFEAQAMKHLDPPKKTFEGQSQIWRGQKVDLRPTWGGKKI